jgi:nicotinamide phosphoribosyltransferase
MFKINPLYLTDGYKVGHKAMLAPRTTKLYGTWIPRSLKYAPKGITKIVSFGQQLTWRYIHDIFEEYFFHSAERQNNFECSIFGQTPISVIYDLEALKKEALQFITDMSMYLGMEYDGEHFEELWELGYLPIRVKALPEGIETDPNIPHMTFVNTVDGYAWLTLYLETMISNLAWKSCTAATIAKLYRRQAEEWVAKTDLANSWLVDYMCHDFSSRGLSGPHDMISVGLGHATSFKGSDTLAAIPAARYYYDEPKNQVCVNSVNASEHSVSTTKIFTVGEQQMIADWLEIFPKGILSLVSDTFDLWKLITEYLPANKEAIMTRDGKLVIRPDSGDPVDIICGFVINDEGDILNSDEEIKDGGSYYKTPENTPEEKGVIELLWDIFGGTVNEQGYKVLDSHIGAIYGDSITPQRQLDIYSRLEAKGFAATNIVLGVGSFTYQFNTRDTLGFAAKGSWFEVMEPITGSPNPNILEWRKVAYNIFKNPVTDDGFKISLKGLLRVDYVNSYDDYKGDIRVFTEQTPLQESTGLLQLIYEDGEFYNKTTLAEIRKKLLNL